MPVNITITLSEKTARYYRSIASMGRMCDFIEVTLKKVKSHDESEEEEIEETLNLITEAKAAIMEVHLVIREQLVKAGVKPLWTQI